MSDSSDRNIYSPVSLVGILDSLGDQMISLLGGVLMSAHQQLIASYSWTIFGPLAPCIQLNLEVVQLQRVEVQLKHQIVPNL